MKKWKSIAVMVCALIGLFALVMNAGCTAKQVTTEVVAADAALQPLKAQIAALPEGPVKIKMQKAIAKLENGAADTVGWTIAVAELESYFQDLILRLKQVQVAKALVGASTQPAGP